MTGLAGYSAVITGASRGIGAAVATALAEAGVKVTLAARSEDKVIDVAKSLEASGHEAFYFPCDVTDPLRVLDLVRAAREAMGRIDILVNNAGTAASSPLARIPLIEWQRIMDVNATGTFLCTQAVWGVMTDQCWGRVVNVASIAGLRGGKYISAYTAAKHAVVGFTRAMAAEAVGSGITVNAVCPGYVDTPLTDETISRVMHHTGKSREESLNSVLEKASQARLIHMSEVTREILRLCNAGSDAPNGELVVIDGSDSE